MELGSAKKTVAGAAAMIAALTFGLASPAGAAASGDHPGCTAKTYASAHNTSYTNARESKWTLEGKGIRSEIHFPRQTVTTSWSGYWAGGYWAQTSTYVFDSEKIWCG